MVERKDATGSDEPTTSTQAADPGESADAARTLRQRLADRLRSVPGTPSELAVEFDTTPSAILDHLEHVARSVDGAPSDECVLVAPPSCRACGFDAFDDPLNRPSRCPVCKEESIDEPTVTIE